LFSARTGEDFFWSSRPAPILLGACCFSLSLSTIIACSWPESYPDKVHTKGLWVGNNNPGLAFWVWWYSFLWWIVQDLVKVFFWNMCIKYSWLKVNVSGAVELTKDLSPR